MYPTLSDTSTTEDLEEIQEVTETETLQYAGGITYNGTTYQDPSASQQASEETGADPSAVTAGDAAQDGAAGAEAQASRTPEEELVMEQVSSLQSRINNVVRALTTLNSAGQTRFNTLDELRLTLNQTVDIRTFPETGTVLESAD